MVLEDGIAKGEPSDHGQRSGALKRCSGGLMLRDDFPLSAKVVFRTLAKRSRRGFAFLGH
jgi:hypothetical protein